MSSFIIVRYVWQILRRGPSCLFHPWAAPKRPILDRFKGDNTLQTRLWQMGVWYLCGILHYQDVKNAVWTIFSMYAIDSITYRTIYHNLLESIYNSWFLSSKWPFFKLCLIKKSVCHINFTKTASAILRFPFFNYLFKTF